MKKVLLTGASGFLGRHCLPLLESRGYEVHAVTSHQPQQSRLPVCWHKADLLIPGRATELIAKVSPDYLLHFAWYTVPGKYWESMENLRWVQASLELLRAFSEIQGKRVVMAGSCAEYDWTKEECCERDTALLPATLYGVCKNALQSILFRSSRQAGLSSAWGRIFFMYGPGEPASRLVSSVIIALLRGAMAQCTNGLQVLDFLHVEDAASAFVDLLESDVQGPVNIASGAPLSVKFIVERIAQKMDRADSIRFGGLAPSAGPSRLFANIQRLRGEVGWSPRTSLDKGLDQMIAWSRNNLATEKSAAQEAAAR